MKTIPLLITTFTLCACKALENDTDVALADVPDAAIAAARQAVPGIDIAEAEIEEEGGQKIYELSGEADGREYEIEVSGTGEILEVEED
jgi:uncharacterized membrane protein YkoI